ncbi:MAG: hypothetical protein ABL967_19210 [Bryobacteraceae bacterium]
MTAYIESPCREIETEIVLRYRPAVLPMQKPLTRPQRTEAVQAPDGSQSWFDRCYPILLPASLVVNAVIVFLLVGLIR